MPPRILSAARLSLPFATAIAALLSATSASATNLFWDTSQSWTLYDVAGTTSNFDNLSLTTINWLDSGSNPFSTTGGSFSLSQSGNDVMLNYVIPEPNVAALIGGFGVLALLRRRR